MAREQFVEIAFRRKTLALIAQANEIIKENMDAGYTMTLRQLYYQFVKRNWLENNRNNYERLGSVVNDARKAGMIDWEAIEDRVRNLNNWATYRDPGAFLASQHRYYAENVWRDQDIYLECWIEKDALIGVIERPCGQYRVPYMACRGYPSSSVLYDASKRFERQIAKGKRVVVLYLGDHDPAGIDIPRSNGDLLDLFAGWGAITIKRLALNMDQVEEFTLPPNYAKDSDSKTGGYIETFGTDECWELDALDNATIDRIVRDAIRAHMDEDKYRDAIRAESANENRLKELAENWDDVRRYLKYHEWQVSGWVSSDEISADDVLKAAEGEDNDADDDDG